MFVFGEGYEGYVVVLGISCCIDLCDVGRCGVCVGFWGLWWWVLL